jgi:hypothetical protein
MADGSEAPAQLEQVRVFLNTWSVPNDTRVPCDALPELVREPAAWRRTLPGVVGPPPTDDTAVIGALSSLRDDLRAALGQPRPPGLDARLQRLRWRARLGGPGGPVALVGEPETTETSLLAMVLAAVTAGTWHRLRACPDCGWVFYDSSRNARRTWCSMDAGPGARGCGSIAKTRAYRSRQRARHPG